MIAAKATIKAEFQAVERLHNTDAPVRTSTSPDARRTTELSSFDAYNAVGARKKQKVYNKLSRYTSAERPTRSQDPLQWWL
jgi:hypothetical protein